ncbi:hypothetical protein H7097_03535 [Aeromicrobium sp.]|nr:hypothetical protein [Candidatus Saccharibacteria bacterium]
MNAFYAVLRHRSRVLAYLFGSFVVSLWTVLRHISNGVNFDVVGQIGLAQQWANGFHSGAQLGATNYVLKIPLYMLVNDFGFISPMHRLLLLALLCNIATFALLFLVFEKIAKLYEIRNTLWLYLAMIWLATIAGNVFWTDYANSRNLETVGGILFLYLVLKFIRSQSVGTASLAVLAGSIAFFADSLQLYICGGGACLFVVARWLIRRQCQAAVVAAKIIGIILLSYGGARLIRIIVEHTLHVSFLLAPRVEIKLDAATVSQTLRTVCSSTLDIFGANVFKRPYDLNSVREALSLVVLVVVIALLIRAAATIRSRSAMGLGLSAIFVSYVIYVASGQVLVPVTYRYLIMVPLLLILLISNAGDAIGGRRTVAVARLQFVWLAVSLVSSVMLAGAVATHWPTRHANDAHIYATSSFLTSNNLQYSLSSREAGITTTYFAGGRETVLPLLCTADNRLVLTDLFYDKAAFESFQNYQGNTAIIVPGTGIVSGSDVCDTTAITAQFGPPDSQGPVPGVGTALVYTPAELRAHLAPLPVEDVR